MVNVSSLPKVGDTLFDLDTQAGITAVLLSIRASQLSASEKNDLRDLIFLYTNGGRDQSVRIGLEQKITALGLTPVASKGVNAVEKAPQKELPTIGTFRAAPSFVVPPMVTQQSAPSAVVEEMPVPVAAMPVIPEAPEPIMEPKKPAPLFSQQQPPAPVSEPAVPQDVVVPPVATPKPDQQVYLDRIREIKSLVNEKVGNPVNLVDIDNTIGREYMSALLDAMKRINSGMSAVDAMKRLEAAYLAVEQKLQSVSDTPQIPVQVNPPIVSETLDPLPPPPAPTPTTPPARYTPPVAAAPTPTVTIQQPVAQTVPAPAPLYQPLADTVTPPVQAPRPEMVAAQPVVPTPNYTQAPQTQTAQPAAHTFSSLADMVQQSHAQTGLPTTPTQAAPLQSGDPLLSPQVEEGLEQLLSEWSIFKKSGIFGTGPKGREHPLYVKMAELQIPLLLAGRFEGATQEVRQSLTDYMNGWRYEQGLIYEKRETFEHYLRRVIKHILEVNAR